MDDVPGLEDQIQPCSKANYDEARKGLGLYTLNKMPRGDILDIASESEGFVSYLSYQSYQPVMLITSEQAPWKVITPCPEDKEGIQQIIKTGLLPKKTVLALLMVDFWYETLRQSLY